MSSRIYKAEIYYIDHDNQIQDEEQFKNEVESAFWSSAMGNIDFMGEVSASESFEWDDDIDLNKVEVEKETFDKYFKRSGWEKIANDRDKDGTSETYYKFERGD